MIVVFLLFILVLLMHINIMQPVFFLCLPFNKLIINKHNVLGAMLGPRKLSGLANAFNCRLLCCGDLALRVEGMCLNTRMMRDCCTTV